MCSSEHITTFNTQLAGCRGLLTVPSTVISMTDAVNMPLSSSISMRHTPLILQVYDTSALFEVLEEHQIACYDMPNGTVDHQQLVYRLYIHGCLSMKWTGASTPTGDDISITKLLPMYLPWERPPPWPPPSLGHI